MHTPDTGLGRINKTNLVASFLKTSSKVSKGAMPTAKGEEQSLVLPSHISYKQDQTSKISPMAE